MVEVALLVGVVRDGGDIRKKEQQKESRNSDCSADLAGDAFQISSPVFGLPVQRFSCSQLNRLELEFKILRNDS
jgi:hypothetical protein